MSVAQPSMDEMTSSQQARSTRHVQDYLTITLFLAPAFILFLIFLVYPIFRSIYFSLFNWNGLGPAVDFVGWIISSRS